jgi:hypothetical protein
LLLTVLGAFVSGALASPSWIDQIEELRAALDSDEVATREARAEELARARELAVTVAERMLKDYSSVEKRADRATLAAQVLGEQRAFGSIPLLIEHMKLRSPHVNTKRAWPFWERYPCVGALIRMGVSSSGAVIERMRVCDDAEERLCGAFVLHETMGREWALRYVGWQTGALENQGEARRLEELARAIEEI